MRIAIAATIAAFVLVSCGDAPQPPVEPPDVVKHLATRDTVRVVVQETLRTVVHDTVQRALLAALSGLAPDQIVKVRWGKSLAPADHPLARGAFLSVWAGSGEADWLMTI